jgi:hypothetical protein
MVLKPEPIPTQDELPDGWEHSIGEAGTDYYYHPFKFYVDKTTEEFRCFTLIMDTVGTGDNIEHAVQLSSELYHEGDCWDEDTFRTATYENPQHAKVRALEFMMSVAAGQYDDRIFDFYCDQHGNDHEPFWRNVTPMGDEVRTEGYCEYCGNDLEGWWRRDEIIEL